MVQLHVKTTAGKKFSLEIELEKTVGECKTALVAQTEVPEPQQRLIFKGKVLKDDQTLASYGIAAEDTMYFVRGSANPRPAASAAPAPPPAAAAAASPFNFPLFAPPAPSAGGMNPAANPNPFGNLFGAGGMGAGAGGAPNMAAMQQQLMQNPDMMRQMMESPIMQSVMNNPDIMRSMMQSNPAIQQLMEQNPQLNHIMNDPELLRQSMEAMRNPAAMREMMRSQDTALRNIESHPEGFNALRRMYHDVQEPLLDAAASGQRAPTNAFTMPGLASSTTTNAAQPTDATAAPRASSASANPWGMPTAAAGTSNAAATAANPWATPAFGAGAGGFGGADPFGAGLNAGAANPQMMAQLLQSPMMAPMLEQVAQDPQLFLSQMEQMNPQMAAMLNSNPQMRQMMMNPDFLRSMLNPQNIQAMMQMQSAMSQLQGSGLMPGLPGMGTPMGGAAAPATPGMNPFDFSALLGGGGTNAFGGGASSTPAANPEELYASQLIQLSDMGFPNREQNIRALQATAGNVHAAVERLLSGQRQQILLTSSKRPGMLDAAELRRASATDASAVQQYLHVIESEELNSLLDQFADAESKKKEDSAANEWLALVHVLLRTDSTRQRTATRIIQSLWRGHASEMEALRWVSEISLGYMASVSSTASREPLANKPVGKGSNTGVVGELQVMLQIVLQFVRDIIGQDRHGASTMKKALPHLLALIPVLLHLLIEAKTSCDSSDQRKEDEAASTTVDEHVVQLLELPWDLRSISHLLELLREHSSLVTRHGWMQLRQSVEQLIASSHSTELPTECLNPLVRECLLLAAAADTNSDNEATSWIHVARFLVQRLPVHMRQEAEFNVQMCLHQCPALATLICDALLGITNGTLFSERSNLSLDLDASDAVLLLHAIRASKPLLHHHLIGSALIHASSSSSTDSGTVFVRAQRLIRLILIREPSCSSMADPSFRHAVASILDFGGRQQHARLWKAQLFHKLARYWMANEQTHDNTVRRDGGNTLGLLVLDDVFYLVLEVREEILQNLLEATRVPSQSARALKHLEHLVRDHKTLVAPHRQLLEDWLSALASGGGHGPHQPSLLKASFQAVAPLVVSLKDFYNFAMVFLRKQLSSTHHSDRQLAIDVWCSWLEMQGHQQLDAQQEEEVVLAVKHAVQQCTLNNDGGRAFQRLQRLFALSPVLPSLMRMRVSSLVDFHRLLTTSLADFIEPVSNRKDTSGDDSFHSDHVGEDHGEVQDEDELAAGRLCRFRVASLDHFFSQNGSVASALQLGSLFESVVSSLVGVERMLKQLASEAGHTPAHQVTADDARLGHDVVRWLEVFVRHHDEFFLWVSSGVTGGSSGQSSTTVQLTGAVDKRFVCALAARVSLGCAFCNLTFHRQLEEQPKRSLSARWEALEMQLCLARLWRKFSATTPIVDTQKDHQLDTKLLQAGTTNLRPHVSQLFGEIAMVLANAGSRQGNNAGISLDAMLFVLDVYIQSLSQPRAALASQFDDETHRPCGTRDVETASELELLVQIYSVVINNFSVDIDSENKDSDNGGAGDGGGGAGDGGGGVAFTTYGESLASHFPRTMRHLVLPDNVTSVAVTLSARAADELLSRICVAIGKATDIVCLSANATAMGSMRDSVFVSLMGAGGKPPAGSELVQVASRFLEDLKHVMNNDAFVKFRMANAALVRKMAELAVVVDGRERGDERDENVLLARIARFAYTLICEHVVHQLPLLRVLLSLSFPTTGLQADRDEGLLARVAVVLDACGFPQRTGDKIDQEPPKRPTKSKTTTTRDTAKKTQRYRRLRQITSGDEQDDNGDHDETEHSSQDHIKTHAEVNNDAQQNQTQQQLQPHECDLPGRPRLTTATAQTAALLAVLTLVENIHTRAVQSLLAKKRPTRPQQAKANRGRTTPEKEKEQEATDPTATYQLTQKLTCIHTLLSYSLFVAIDVSWVSMRALAKLLSILEAAVRVGKSLSVSAAASREDASLNTQLAKGFESSVRVVVRGRAWLALLREATANATAKSKLSSTILKLDVFLLDVPLLVASMMKAECLPLSSKSALRLFLATMESGFSNPVDAATKSMPSANSSASTSTKRHLVGVVPIVLKKRRKRLRSRHAYIDSCLADEDGDDAFADLEDFIA